MDHKYHPPTDPDELHDVAAGIADAASRQQAGEALVVGQIAGSAASGEHAGIPQHGFATTQTEREHASSRGR